jgi:hypothetical protein
MKYFHKQRLLKLAHFLDSVPRKKFDIGSFITVKSDNLGEDFSDEYDYWTVKALKNNECGTVACACGWAATIPSFRKAGYKLNDFGTIMFNGEKDWGAIEDFFGLEETESSYLFLGSSYPYDYKTTPKQVKQRILKFLKQKEKDNVLSKN